jgi:hypothetical protein
MINRKQKVFVSPLCSIRDVHSVQNFVYYELNGVPVSSNVRLRITTGNRIDLHYSCVYTKLCASYLHLKFF